MKATRLSQYRYAGGGYAAGTAAAPVILQQARGRALRRRRCDHTFSYRRRRSGPVPVDEGRQQLATANSVETKKSETAAEKPQVVTPPTSVASEQPDAAVVADAAFRQAAAS